MSDTLQRLSDELAAVVEQAGASTVRVDARRRLPATGIVWSQDGLIVTAHHVIESDEEIQIGLPNGESVPATLVGRDPNSDVALLRVQGNVTPATWADGDDLKVGHLVLALGRPTGAIQATLGVVSAFGEGEAEQRGRPFEFRIPGGRHGRGGGGRRGRRVGGRGGGMFWMQFMAGGGHVGDHIRTDVVMYPGFSGGPLVDASGQVRGMNTSGFGSGSSLTVPTASIRSAVDSLVTHGRVRRGFLGVGAQPAQLPAAQAEALDQDTGLLVVSVEDNSPAANGGVLVGDIIVALAGESVTHLEELLALLTGERVGKSVPVSIVRGGELREVTVTIGERV